MKIKRVTSRAQITVVFTRWYDIISVFLPSFWSELNAISEAFDRSSVRKPSSNERVISISWTTNRYVIIFRLNRSVL